VIVERHKVMGEHVHMNANLTHVPDGREIIAREVARGTHPRWRDMVVPFSNVLKLLLEDGSELFACAWEDCDFTGAALANVNGHYSVHIAERKPFYSVDVIKAVLRAVGRAKLAQPPGRKSRYMIDAANDLNVQGIPTYRGEPWSSGNVSAIYRMYKSVYRVHIRKPQTALTAAAIETRDAPLDTDVTTGGPVGDTSATNITDDLSELERILANDDDDDDDDDDTTRDADDDVSAESDTLHDMLLDVLHRSMDVRQRAQELENTVTLTLREYDAQRQRFHAENALITPTPAPDARVQQLVDLLRQIIQS
jgi:hypothetical protein